MWKWLYGNVLFSVFKIVKYCNKKKLSSMNNQQTKSKKKHKTSSKLELKYGVLLSSVCFNDLALCVSNVIQ